MHRLEHGRLVVEELIVLLRDMHMKGPRDDAVHLFTCVGVSIETAVQIDVTCIPPLVISLLEHGSMTSAGMVLTWSTANFSVSYASSQRQISMHPCCTYPLKGLQHRPSSKNGCVRSARSSALPSDPKVEDEASQGGDGQDAGEGEDGKDVGEGEDGKDVGESRGQARSASRACTRTRGTGASLRRGPVSMRTCRAVRVATHHGGRVVAKDRVLARAAKLGRSADRARPGPAFATR